MATEPTLFAAVLIAAVGLVVRTLSPPELLTGVALPVADTELTTAFVGDFIIVVGLATLVLTMLEMTVGLPELVWTVFGGGVVLAVIAMPILAKRYIEWRVEQTEHV